MSRFYGMKKVNHHQKPCYVVPRNTINLFAKTGIRQQRREECFVETHTIAGGGQADLNGRVPVRIRLEPGTTKIFFRDFTINHNKTLIQLVADPVFAASFNIIIQTRDSETPITTILPTGDIKILQVENFESLTISNPTTAPGEVDVFIQKTFCICCPDQTTNLGPFLSSCVKARPQKNRCSVSTHVIFGMREAGRNIGFDIPIEAGETKTVFEDFTKNHNKTLLQLSTPGDQPEVAIAIRTRGSSTPITDIISREGDTTVFQVEDFQSLAVTNPNPVRGVIRVFIEKTFCICCGE